MAPVAGWPKSSQEYGLPHSEEMEKVLMGLEEEQLGWLEIVIDENEGYGPVSVAFLQEWESMYPNEAVTLVGDDTEVGMSGAIFAYTRPTLSSGLPQGGLVDEGFRWSTLGILDAITAAANQL